MKKLFTFFLALISGVGTMIASEYSTIADLYNMAQDSAFTLGAFDVVYVPSFQNGSNMYIKDNTGSMVIYKRNYGLQAGDHVAAGLQGKINIYYGLYEITPVSTKDELTITSGEAPAPQEATELPSATNVSQFVVYKNVSFTADTAFVSGTRHAVYGIWNNRRITFFNQYYIGATLSADKTYNITAVNTIYNTTLQAYPLLVEEVIGGTPASPELCLVDSGTCGENLTWKLSCDNVLTISGTGAMTDWSSYSNVPWYSFRKDITSVTIPNDVTSIGEYAFDGCSGLKSVTIPNSVTSIGAYAFYNCSGLTSIEIPNSVTSIGDRAFDNCSGLMSVTIPNSVTSMGYAAFAGCSGLTEINVAADHPNYCSVDGILFNKEKTTIVQYPGGKSGAYSIPSGVTSIGEYAFSGCSGLTSIEIPNSVTSIGDRAFYNCSGLTSIEIPNSVTSIGVWAFAMCEGLTSVTIPNSVTIIGVDAFLSCASLTSIEIPNSVTSIGYGAFSGCSGLTSIEIPNRVTSIEKGAFSVCTGLTSITCKADVPPTCGDDVFNKVDKSIPLYVPAESIEAYKAADQWSEFTNIQPIKCLIASGTCGENLTWELSCDNVLTISGTGEMTNWTNSADNPFDSYRDSITSITIGNGVTSIGRIAFYGCNMTNVTIGNSITSIGENAFTDCYNLTEINVATDNPNYCSVNGVLFNKGKTILIRYPSKKSETEYTIPNSVTSIGSNAFNCCFRLTSVTIPNSVTNIEDFSFNKSGLTSVAISNKVTSIGHGAFSSCTDMTELNVAADNPNYCSVDGVLFNKNITTLLQYPCGAQGSYTVPNGVTNIGSSAFYWCTSLTSVTIPNSVTSIGSYAFQGCSGLMSVTIPNSVTSIGNSAFYWCDGLKSITCKTTTPPTCGSSVFNDVDKSIPLYVPANSADAYKNAYQWKDFSNIYEALDPTQPNLENFESYQSATTYNVNYQAPCWTTGNANPNAANSYKPYIYKSANYASSGTNTYRIYSTATYGPAWVASPELDCEKLSDIYVTFNMYAGASYWWICGVMTDPQDINTFIVLDSIKGTGTSTQYQYNLREYADLIPEDAKYFAWRTRYGMTDYLYLDDVSFEKINCALPKPSVQDITYNSARIYSGLQESLNWNLVVETVADSAIVVYQGVLDAYDRFKKLTDLQENTAYVAYLSSRCDNGTSPVITLSFKTPCKPITPEALGTITFSADEGYVSGTNASRYLPCWTVGNKSGNASPTSSYIPYVGTSTTYMHDGNRYLYMYSYVNASNNYDGAYAIMPELEVEDISQYQINFWARTTSSTGANYHDNLVVGIISDPNDLSTFVPVDTLTLSHTAYEPFTIAFDKYQGGYLGIKGRYIMFLAETGDIVTSYSYAYISEILVEKIPNCRPVTEFTVDSVSENMAILSWEQVSDQYRVMVAGEPVPDSLKATYPWLQEKIVTSTSHVMLLDLNYSSPYYVYAQALCDSSMSSEISMAYAHFWTDCPYDGYILPYYNDFEHSPKTGTGNKPLCWDGVYLTMDTVGATQSYPYVSSSTSYAYSSSKCMYMYSYGYWNNTSAQYTTNYKSYAVAPKVAGDLNDLMVRFFARKTSNNSTATTKYGNILEVGYVTDASQEGIASSFVKIADVTISDATYDQYRVVISDYTQAIPKDARIALRADWSAQGFETPTSNTYFYASFYIDNFEITYTPNCFAPKIEVTGTSLTTADIVITPTKEADHKWQITMWNNELLFEERIVTADSTHVVVTGLEPGTKYWFAARTVCDEANISSWSNQDVSAYTKYYYADSYSFGFERSEGWNYCQGSTSSTYYLHPALEVGYEGGEPTTSYTAYYPYSMENSSSSVYAYGPKEGSLGTGALRWNTTATYWGGYVVFPGVVNAKNRSFEFKARSSYLNASTMQPSSSLNARFEIGTIDKYKGFETYEVLATAELPAMNIGSIGTAENDWLWESYTVEVDSATVANKQMVIRLLKADDSSTRYVHFDNVALGEPKGYGLVSLDKIRTVFDTAFITWNNIDGPWNLTIWNSDQTEMIEQFLNLTSTSKTISGLTPNTEYVAVLQSANAPAGTWYEVTSSQTFKTTCRPLEADNNGAFFWDFNDPSEWERSDVLVGNNTETDSAYYKPGCFTIGTTYTSAQTTTSVYYNWLIQRKGYGYTGAPTSQSNSFAKYEYGRNDSPALRLYSSSTYKTPYIALPELHCDFDTMMIEFYARQFANYAEDYSTVASQNKIISITYLGANYGHEIIVGTLTDPHDFSTLAVIDTLTYKQTNLPATTFVNQDPDSLRYWEKMQLPLAGAKGKYIVLFVPGEKTTLFFVDDLSIKSAQETLFEPTGTQTGEITTTTVQVSWKVQQATLPSVVVLMDEYGEVIQRQTVPAGTTTYTIENLQSATLYQWYVYQTNGTNDSPASATQQFYTECETIHPSYTTGFELEDGWRILPAQTSSSYKQTICWTYENAGTSAVGTNIYNQQNSTSCYSFTGNYALRLYAYSSTYQTYAAMPEMKSVSAYDTLQVNFWMRPGYHSLNTGKIYVQHTLGSTASTADYYYAKSVIVGTMTDPNDASTFVPIDTVTYDGTFAAGDTVHAGNNYLFQRKSVVLTGAKGKHVAFMSTLYAKGETRKSYYDYMWIDDISFSGINPCENPIITEETNVTICEGETFSWNGQTYTTSGTYTHTIPHAGFDCDSVIQVLNLTVKEKFIKVEQPVTICAGESFNWNGLILTQSGEYADTIRSIFGCDSVIEILTVNVLPQKFMLLYDTICEGNYVWFNGKQVYESGIYTATLPSVNGCDSIVNLNLTVLPSSRGEEWYAACEQFTWPFNGKTYTYSGDYADTLLGGGYHGCDSIVTLHLTLYQPSYGELYAVACEEFTWPMNGKTFYTSGDYIDTLHGGSMYGCDSIITLHLTINQPIYQDTTAYSCESFTWHGQTYYESGNYTETIYGGAYNGCDLIETLHLTINHTNYTDTTAWECESFTWHGQTYYSSGVYVDTLTNVAGCDSIVSLYLYIQQSSRSEEWYTSCGNFTWNGNTFYTSGDYVDTLHSGNVYGCDSIMTLHLTIYSPVYNREVVVTCGSEPYVWHGQVLTNTGVYYDTLTAVNGCDSICRLELNFYPNSQTELTVVECDAYTWNGITYTESGDYEYITQNIYGCDSVVTLHLTILKAEYQYIQHDTLALYQATDYPFNEPGEYTWYDTIRYVSGCDSLITTHFIVILPTPVYTITCTAEHGTIAGPATAEYRSEVSLQVISDYGYHFVRWSDGDTSNPRRFIITEDVSFTALFVVDRMGSCGDNNDLTWMYDANARSLTITGEGALNSNYTYGVEAPNNIEKLIIAEGVTSIGAKAFKNEKNMVLMTLCSTLQSVGDSAFAGCKRLEEITLYAERVPDLSATGYAEVGNKKYIYLYVPEGRERAYQRDTYWGEFDIRVKGAEAITEPIEDVTVEPTANTAEITWPAVADAHTYSIEISKDGVVICKLTFNAQGQLTGIAFAANRAGAEYTQQEQVTGFRFTVTSLDSNTTYGYAVASKDASNTVVDTKTGTFTTEKNDVPTDMDEVSQEPRAKSQKLLIDGQLYILRDGKMYNVQGVEVK